MNALIWGCFFVVAWGASLAVVYSGAWHYGRASGINWSTEQIYGAR